MPEADPANLQLTIAAATGTELVPFLREHLRAAHAILNPPLSELSVALVGDATMGDLHQRFMNIPGPTDVLTFPLEEDDDGQVTSGEVVVCVPEASRRAQEEEIELRHETLLYALHGMLHLCGYNDLTDAEYKRMHEMEDQILRQLGVGAIFSKSNSKKA